MCRYNSSTTWRASVVHGCCAMARLGAIASNPTKTIPRNIDLLLWTFPSQYLCRVHAAVVSEADRMWPTYGAGVWPSDGEATADPASRASPLQIDGNALPLRITVEHSFERVLAAHPALLEAAVRLTWELAEPLVDLYPAGLDRVRGVDGLADVSRPHVGGEAV